MKIHQEDIEWVRENIPARDVAEYLGLEIRKNSILCPDPNHNDRHYGNCNFNREGNLHCYACNKNFSSIDLMMYKGNMKFAEAVEQLADLSGYQFKTEDPEKDEKVPHLSKNESELLEIPITYKKVKIPTTIADYSTGERCIERIGEHSIEYVGYREEPNPWLYLKQEDPVAYKWFIEERVKFGIKRMAQIYNEAKQKGNQELAEEALRRYKLFQKIKARFQRFQPEGLASQ